MNYLVYKYKEDWSYEDYILVKYYIDDKEAAYNCMREMQKKEKSDFLYMVKESKMRIL